VDRYDIPLSYENNSTLQNQKVKMILKGGIVDRSQWKYNFWTYFNGSVDTFALSVHSNLNNCGNIMQSNVDNDDLKCMIGEINVSEIYFN